MSYGGLTTGQKFQDIINQAKAAGQAPMSGAVQSPYQPMNMQQMPTPTQPGFAVGAPQQMPVPTQPGFAVGDKQQMPINQTRGFGQNPFIQQMMDWRSSHPNFSGFDFRNFFQQPQNSWQSNAQDGGNTENAPMRRIGLSFPGILSGMY